jgi:Na+-translocating ferredoxin:NAD+ oxidoreductase subunit C
MTTRSLTRGGLKLETHKQRSTMRPLRPAPLAEIFVLPLHHHAGLPARPVVAPGDRVSRGQPIAEPAGEISAWLHAPASGVVRAIETQPSPLAREGSLCIVIENDGANRTFDAHSSLPNDADPQALREHIARGGIVGLGGAIFPTGAKLARAAEKNAHLIVNGAECEPWISCDDMLMRERADEVIAGAALLCRALRAESCTIAVEDDMFEAAEALRAAAKAATSSAEIVVVPSIYPAGGERQLITALTGLEVPSGGLPQDIGIVCQNVGTAAAIARWVRDGEPLIRRIVTVTGGAIRHAANLETYIGTPISALIAECGGFKSEPQNLIMGGTMMGIAVAEETMPVIKGTNCILVAAPEDLQPPGPEMPCIRCGACSEACPAFLLPQQLHRFALASELDNLDRYGLLDCIECGCCDYVCPSQIPLVERFRLAKPELKRHFVTRAMAPLAKANFEAREARLVRVEEDRRAKLAEKRKSITNKS